MCKPLLKLKSDLSFYSSGPKYDSVYLVFYVPWFKCFFNHFFAELINHASKSFPNCFNGYCKLKGEHICFLPKWLFSLQFFLVLLTAQKYDLFSTISTKTISRESDCKVFLKKE